MCELRYEDCQLVFAQYFIIDMNDNIDFICKKSCFFKITILYLR